MTAIVPIDEAAVMRQTYCRGDRLMAILLAIHALAALCFASFYETWLVTFVVTGMAVSMFALSWILLPASMTTRTIAGVSLQAFVALHIYQLHGLAEMHFFFFTSFTAMVLYQDWRCMWLGAGLIIGQHILFAVLQNTGTNYQFFEGDYIGATKLSFHFGIALIHVVLCNLCAQMLRNQTLKEARAVAAMTAARNVAERASSAKTEFLGTMSHELRTPLSGVLGMSELLLLRKDLPPQVQEELSVIHTSAAAMVAIVNDSLDLDRIEAGRLLIATEPMDLRRLAEEVIEMLTSRAAKDHIELAMRWRPGGPRHLRGDAGRWRQVLTNLVGNAIKFASGRHVLLELEVAPAAAGERTDVTIRIDDSGPGIPPDVLPRLFRRFEQADAGVYSCHGGSGLGLAISRELVRHMGGTLEAHSVLGAGATFVIRTRLEVTAAAEPEPQVASRMLLVGSRALTIEILAEQLEAMGARVDVAYDAASARRLHETACATNRPYELLFCDPDLLGQLEPIATAMRVVQLGGEAKPGGERIVWLSRHDELRRVTAGSRGLKSRPAEPPALQLRVLLAEDDPVCARIAKQMLQLLGCTWEHVDNGALAVERVGQVPFDAVLLDCRMPVLDGYEAMKSIRAAEAAGQHVPIVALSANTLPADQQLCRECGADAFLGKPVQLRQLAAALEKVVTTNDSQRGCAATTGAGIGGSRSGRS